MPTANIQPITLSVTYMPAVLKHTANSWHIEYYVLHPQKNQMVRQRVKLNKHRKHYARLYDFKLFANEMCNQINAKLCGGWNPFFQNDNLRLYTPLAKVISLYIDEKVRELRPATLRTYKSWCKIFGEWCDKNIPNTYASLINRVVAIKYLDYLYNDRKLNAVAYNNHIKQGRAFFNWCVEKCYVKENPFETITKKREGEKRRILIESEYRKKISEYLKEKNPAFLTICKLVFTSLIRPKEIRHIQVKHLALSKHCIYIPPENAKTHNGRFSAISDDILHEITALLTVNKISDDYYLFGEGLTPNRRPCPEAKMRKEWEKVRRALKLPQEMQLYSLRDTGINNMLKSGIDPLTVMQHADHHDLAMTTRYANHADEHLIERIVKEAPDF